MTISYLVTEILTLQDNFLKFLTLKNYNFDKFSHWRPNVSASGVGLRHWFPLILLFHWLCFIESDERGDSGDTPTTHLFDPTITMSSDENQFVWNKPFFFFFGYCLLCIHWRIDRSFAQTIEQCPVCNNIILCAIVFNELFFFYYLYFFKLILIGTPLGDRSRYLL